MAEGPKIAFVKPIREVVFTTPYEVGGRERVFVVPANIHLAAPDRAKTIRWVNQTGGRVQVWLASVQHLLKAAPGVNLSEPIAVAPGDDLVVAVKDGVEDCQYDYHVFCEKIGNFADGNSPPSMGCP
jgi:hypothetical protein